MRKLFAFIFSLLIIKVNDKIIVTIRVEGKKLNLDLILIGHLIAEGFRPCFNPELIRVVLLLCRFLYYPVSHALQASRKGLALFIMAERKYCIMVYHRILSYKTGSSRQACSILKLYEYYDHFFKKSGILICLDSTLLVRGATPLKPPPNVVGSGEGAVFCVTPGIG